MAPKGIQVRKARKSDLPHISAIERESFPDPWDDAAFLETLEYFPSTFFVAENHAHIAGFIAAGIEDTGEERYGHIMNIAVEQEYRNRGVGAMLVKRLEYECLFLGVSAMSLEVRVSNHIAQRFYSNIGYNQVFQLAGYYSNGDDAIVMMKWFTY